MNEAMKSFIEVQFPVSKISKESYKERTAGSSQTITGLGKWWGRKPLVMIRAAIIGLLMPVTDDPMKDREIFLKIMTMDDDGLSQRKSKAITQKELYEHLTPREKEKWFDPAPSADKPKLKRGLSQEDKEELQHLVFMRFSYDKKLEYCSRPEQIEGPSKESWREINAHLGTTAFSIVDLIQQLGEKQFGHTPRVGDAFCGGGSIPFEAARIGCEAYGSDLNPVAALLSWAALNIVGGGEEVATELRQTLAEVYAAVDSQICEWGIEHNERGWRADAYLYCMETTCPECGWKVPLAPSWVIGEKSMCVAKLDPIDSEKRFDIRIESGVSAEEMKKAKEKGTIKSSTLVCPYCEQATPITRLRGDRRGEDGTEYGLRMWESHDVVPRPDDVYQERLYCIRWIEKYKDNKGKEHIRKHYMNPSDQDMVQEEKVMQLLMDKFDDWQAAGYIPSRKIEPGYNTDQPIRERGWTYWHHLFNPRQLLVHGLFFSKCDQLPRISTQVQVELLLEIGRLIDTKGTGCKLLRWNPHPSKEGHATVFSNQALNTIYNYCHRTIEAIEISKEKAEPVQGNHYVLTSDARMVSFDSDIWITDPPYADAVNYHELSEFFLAWYEKRISKLFKDIATDSKRVFAISGRDDLFRKDMVDCYKNITLHMEDKGKQIVMFTHQDPSVWADLTLILWAAGLSVTSAWCIATETDTNMRTGNYVQGTVILVLRKQTSELTAFLDEISQEVEDEVKSQLDSMLALDDKEDPNFGDTDYQLAAYAAALRVLTKYKHIEEIDVEKELTRIRQAGDISPVEQLIAQAVEIACNYLMPGGIEKNSWQALTPEERFYIKGLEMESHGEYRAGAYQELARGFGLRDYRYLLANARANENRLKTATEFAARNLGDEGFGNSMVRHTLFAVREVVRTEETEAGRNWLRNELGDRYWDQRQLVIALLDYFGKFEINQNMEHWHKDAHAAHLLMGAIRNEDHI